MSKITLDNLSDNLKEYLNGLGLTEEQVLNLINENGLNEEELKAMLKDTMSINELSTNSKTVIGAINELFQSANNGKELIASAIGEPVSKDDTFQAMSSDINSLLSTFKTNMMNNGITVESGDKFKSLIDKIATMVEEGEGKGIQFASGDLNVDFLIAPSISNSVSITYDASVNFGFKPSILLVSIPSYAYTGYETSLNKITGINTVNSVIRNIDGISKTTYMLGSPGTTTRIQVDVTNVTENGFKISATRAGTQTSGCYLYLVGPFTYYAIGVGEEDTTLRDSLASILTDEGVSVTEEDDMASLITKVDEEFNEKKQELSVALSNKGVTNNENESYEELITKLNNLCSVSIVSGNDFTLIDKDPNFYEDWGGPMDVVSHDVNNQFLVNSNGTYKVTAETSVDNNGSCDDPSVLYVTVKKGSEIIYTSESYTNSGGDMNYTWDVPYVTNGTTVTLVCDPPWGSTLACYIRISRVTMSYSMIVK